MSLKKKKKPQSWNIQRYPISLCQSYLLYLQITLGHKLNSSKVTVFQFLLWDNAVNEQHSNRDVWRSCFKQFDQLKADFFIIFMTQQQLCCFEKCPIFLVLYQKLNIRWELRVKHQCWPIPPALVGEPVGIPKDFLILCRNGFQK